jgi:hypothetical protein
MHEPIRFFGPPAAIVGLFGLGKVMYDLITKDLRLATNTLVILGVAFALAGVGLIADLMVQLNKRRHDVMPSTISDGIS